MDLYLIHWPVPSQGLFTEAWKAMEKLYANSQIRAIGVSNFLPEHLDTLLPAADVVPAVNQFEIHPTLPAGRTWRPNAGTSASPWRRTVRWARGLT